MVPLLVLSILALLAEVSASTSTSSSITPSPSKQAWSYEANAPSNGSLLCTNIRPDSCPPGLFCVDGHCECGVYPYNAITCNGTDSFALQYNCVTFDEVKGVFSVGACIRNRERTKVKGAMTSDTLYHQLPRNVTLLDTMMCKTMKKTGTLCGRCLPDHYPLAYSYNMTCVRCPNARWNWVRYTMAAYFPLTLFCIIILFFKINTTSSYLFPVVFYCQTLSLRVNLRSFLGAVASDTNYSYSVTAKLVFSLYGIWDLDFFRPFYSDLCLEIGILLTLALDYAVAVYPLFLIILSYILILLYDRNYRVVTIAWSPFHALFTLFRRNWNIRTSIIDAFATFFFLAFFKFLSVSFDLLTPTTIYELYPDHFNHTYGLYYAPSIEYFGQEHLPYAILAIFMLCVFGILPVIVLALYPFSFFQRFISLFPIRWHILHTFVDSYYGCYKDGTQPGTRDCRWCASVFFSIRFFQFIIFFFIPSKIVFTIISTLALVLLITLIATLRPFKPSFSHYNIMNILFLQLLLLLSVTIIGISVALLLSPVMLYFFYGLGVVLGLVPFLYFFGGSMVWIYKHKRYSIRLLHHFRAYRYGYQSMPEESEILSDRIENPGGYHSRNLANFTSQNGHRA